MDFFSEMARTQGSRPASAKVARRLEDSYEKGKEAEGVSGTAAEETIPALTPKEKTDVAEEGEEVST